MFPYYFFHEGVEHARRVFVGVGPLQIADDALGDPEGHPYSTVVGNLKMVYFRLAYVQQTLGVPQRSDTLLTQAQEADEARYLVGQGNEHDVLKAPLQHTKILQEIAHHHQGEGLLEAQIKQVLGRPRESEDIVADTLTLRTPAYAAAAFLQRAREQNPDVHSKQASIHLVLLRFGQFGFLALAIRQPNAERRHVVIVR